MKCSDYARRANLSFHLEHCAHHSVSVSLNNFKLCERGGGVSSLSRLLKCVKVGSMRLNMLINRIIGP